MYPALGAAQAGEDGRMKIGLVILAILVGALVLACGFAIAFWEIVDGWIRKWKERIWWDE